jgi:undecaprenyl-diphosphatase
MDNSGPTAALPPRPVLWRLLALFAGLLAPLYAFGALTKARGASDTPEWDRWLQHLIRRYIPQKNGTALHLLSGVGRPAAVIPVDLLLLATLAARKQWATAQFFGLAVGGPAALHPLTKALVGRRRPGLQQMLDPEKTSSFPSGHAMNSMAVTAALIVLAWPTRRRWLVLLLGLLFVLLVGTMRIVLDEHHPSDVAAGWLAALVWVIGVRLIWNDLFDQAEQ